jgi:hypothetical protein
MSIRDRVLPGGRVGGRRHVPPPVGEWAAVRGPSGGEDRFHIGFLPVT